MGDGKGDWIIPFGNERVRIPEAMAQAVPWARQSFIGERDDTGATMLVFVTDEPAFETIVTEGAEAVASFVVMMSSEDIRRFHADLSSYVAGLSSGS